MHKAENFNQLFEKVIKRHKNLKNPLELLVGLANGVDLSSKSLVYEFALKLKAEYGNDLPDEFDYAELIDLITDTYRNEIISTKDQLQAQKTLVEYQHPKRKSVEVTTVSEDGATTPLNADEIKLFWDKFNAEY